MVMTAGSIVLLIAFPVMGLIIVYFILMWSKSHRLRVRDPLHQKGYIKDIWMVEKKDKETGVMNWLAVPLMFPKMKIPEPPKEAIDVGKKGRKYVEAYKLSEDEFVFITDKGIKVKEVDGKLQAFDINEKGKEKLIDSFKPFTATQRQVLVNQYTKANEIGNKGWSKGEIIQMASIGGFVMIIAMFLLFGGDLLKEYQEVRSGSKAMMQMNVEIMKSNAQLAQAMGVSIQDFEISVAQVPSSEDSNVILTDDENAPIDLRGKLGLE